MARPKKGLDYFPLDVNFMQDRKMRRTYRIHSVLGIVVIIRLLCKLYRENLLPEKNEVKKKTDVGVPSENHEAVTEVLLPAEMRLITTETPLLPTETSQNKEKENKKNKSRRKEYSPHPPSENEGGVEKKTIEEMKELFLQPDCV